MERLGVKVPEGQKEKLEEIAESEGYPNRSELVREMIRNFIKSSNERNRRIEEIERRERQLKEGELEIDDLESNDEVMRELEVRE